MSQNNGLLLEVKNLRTSFLTDYGKTRAVDDVSFAIPAKGTLGLVGESGCGKSVAALSIMRLIPEPPGKIESGEILFKGENLTVATERQMRKIRGSRIAMIFQEPMTSLNPVFTIGDQIAESLVIHKNISRRAAWDNAVSMLEKVNIPDAGSRARQYPHQTSGGMRQRAMIAMALACEPDLIIADEPTTALDVTVQAQILQLMEELRRTQGASFLIISHNFGVIAKIADSVAVMYARMIVESAPAREFFSNPVHPYTRGLMKAMPRLDDSGAEASLTPIPGNVPDPAHYPSGCRFHPRCTLAVEECKIQIPELLDMPGAGGHQVRCPIILNQMR